MVLDAADDADEHLVLRHFYYLHFSLGRPEIISEHILCFPPIKHKEEALQILEAPPTEGRGQICTCSRASHLDQTLLDPPS